MLMYLTIIVSSYLLLLFNGLHVPAVPEARARPQAFGHVHILRFTSLCLLSLSSFLPSPSVQWQSPVCILFFRYICLFGHVMRKATLLIILGHYLLDSCFSSENFQDDMRAGGSLPLPIIHILSFYYQNLVK